MAVFTVKEKHKRGLCCAGKESETWILLVGGAQESVPETRG